MWRTGQDKISFIFKYRLRYHVHGHCLPDFVVHQDEAVVANGRVPGCRIEAAFHGEGFCRRARIIPGGGFFALRVRETRLLSELELSGHSSPPPLQRAFHSDPEESHAGLLSAEEAWLVLSLGPSRFTLTLSLNQ